MPTSLYNFQYVPLTGRLPGKSFVRQTEQAINGLAQYVYDNSTNYEAVKVIAQKAEEDSSSALEYSEQALDKAQTALETVGRVYIKTTSAVDLDDYYDSELLLILSEESANLPASISGYLTVMSSDTHDYCMQVYIGIDGSVYKRTATISNNTPTFGAWSETPVTLSSLQTILENYTTVDASNIGVNAQTDNSTAWGNAIGGGEIAESEQRLITGGTVYPLSQNVAQNTSNIATNAADIAQNTGGISANSKRIGNIEKLLQGNLYDYQTDTDSAYTKTVPSGAMPYAGLEKVGGKTVVWNQLVDSGTTTVSTISGHKYYTLIDGTASIVTADGTAITIVDDTADMVCDLTLMFGAGNEPSTVAEFEAMFPADFYPYNAGTLLSAGVTEVESVGKNLLNQNDINLYQNMQKVGDVFENAFADSRAVANLLVQLYSGNTYVYGQNFVIAGDGRKIATFTTTDDITVVVIGHSGSSFDEKIWFNVTLEKGKTYTVSIKQTGASPNVVGGFSFTDVQIEESATATNYVPYRTPIQYPIPTTIRNLEGYGWSAGSVYNEIDFERKVFIKRVGRVDMGTMNYTYYDAYNGIFANATFPSDAKNPYANARGIQAVCSRYAVMTENVTTTSLGDSDKTCTVCWEVFNSANNIVIRDSSAGTDASAFKERLTGVYMYYELATPVETDISEYLTDDNLINVERGGTLTFENQHGDDYRIPVPSEETYMIDLQEALS